MITNLELLRATAITYNGRSDRLTSSFLQPSFESAPPGESAMAYLKSRALFKGRLVSGFARRHMAGESFRQWLSDALSIQMAIYKLDFHFEKSTIIRSSDLLPLWRALEHQLRQIEGGHAEVIWSSFADLRQYAISEARIHESDTIDPREFETIVSLKCADVRIARMLVWSRTKLPMSAAVLRYWHLFDQCWEFIEDLQDIGEDGRDWNFNVWLYIFMAGGDPLRGTEAATATLRERLRKFEASYCQLTVAERQTTEESFTNTITAAQWALRNWSLALFAIHQRQVFRFQHQRNRAELQAGYFGPPIDSTWNADGTLTPRLSLL